MAWSHFERASTKLLQADGRTYGGQLSVALRCSMSKNWAAPPPVNLVPFCFGPPCSLEFVPNPRMQKLRKTVLATGANIEAEIRAPFLFHCHNAANILSRGLAF